MNISAYTNIKPHIVYLVIIGILVACIEHQHREVVRVVTQTKTIDHTVVQNKIQYVDRTITTKKKDGDVIVMTEHTSSEDSLASQSQTKEDIFSKSIQSSAPNYMVSAYSPVTLAPLDPLNLQIVGGIRLASTPIFLNVGTNPRFNNITIGVTLEL